VLLTSGSLSSLLVVSGITPFCGLTVEGAGRNGDQSSPRSFG